MVKYYIFICSIIFGTLKYHSQSLDSLKIKHIEKKSEVNARKINLISEKKSFRWLSLLPTVSVSSHYDPFTQIYKPSITFGISLHNIVNYIQLSNRNRIEREKLAISLQEQLHREITQIDAEILEIKKDSIALSFEQKNIELLEELYSIKSKQYEQNQINLEEKIKYQMQLNNSKNALEIRKLNYNNRKENLINKLKKDLHLSTDNKP